MENLDRICESAEGNPRSETTQSAVAILSVVLGEGPLVDLIATKRLDALLYILAVIKKHDIGHRQAGGISMIVKDLFIDQESFLYKHLGNSGLALSSNLYDNLFGSPKILTNFDLFGWPTVDYTMRKDLSSVQVKVFIKSLSRAIETYLMSGTVPPRHINNGLEHLSQIFGSLCLKIGSEAERGVDTKYSLKDEWWSLYLIANFLGHDYPFLAHDEELNKSTAEREKTVPEAEFFSHMTINAGIAAALYSAFSQLSSIKKSNDIYHTVLELLHGMIYQSESKEGYRPPFEVRMWQQIGTNVVKRYYPAVLRTYLVFIGFCLASDQNQRQGWIGEQAERMRRLLYVDLKPLLDRGEKMVNKELMQSALLPDFMTYENGKFTYTLGFGEGEKIVISEPPAGATPALEGVNLEHLSTLT